MTQLLCRNRVDDFDGWWAVFSSHAEAHRSAGLVLDRVWRGAENSNDVFFLFEVANLEKARAFMSAPEAAEAAGEAEVADAWYHFVETASGY